LDRQTTYDLINSHGRESELLFFATNINDHKYVLNYWINREDWAHAVLALQNQTSPEVFYKTASVLLTNVPRETVNVWVQQRDLDPTKLTPALLSYNETVETTLDQNQAVRYLVFATDHLGSTDPSVHNALISIYASHSGSDEKLLFRYLRSQPNPPYYDVDFALRLCLQFRRVQSGVHIYSSMELYEQSVSLALEHGETELAMTVADTPEEDPIRRKRLWLSIAEKVISEDEGMKKYCTNTAMLIVRALDLLQRCDLLKIEDLVPLFPDFMAIDDFKDEICSALEEYSHQVDRLKRQMDDSARSSQSIQMGIADLGRRYAIIQAGESCSICGYPLLTRQFYVFPCRHTFHADCLVTKLKEDGSPMLKRRINEVQGELGRVGSDEARKKAMEEFDSVVAGECVLCGDLMVKSIDGGFPGDRNELEGWRI
jgi:vacuolar protein sorting-associated protein 18